MFVRAQHACRWTPPEVFPATGSLLTSGDPALLERTPVKLCERVYRIRFLGTEAVKCGSRRIGPDRDARRAPFRREWTRSQPIRTAADLLLEFPVLETRRQFAYQAIAEKACKLKALGMSDIAIARSLGVTDKTVAKAISRIRPK